LISRVSIVAALLALAGAHPVGTPQGNETQAVVRGTVTDPTSADISGARVYFTHGKKTIQMRTSPAGRYSARLAPGIYSLRVTLPGFCDGIRGEFLARAGAEITFDFRLTMAAASVVATVVFGPNGNATPPSRSIGGCYKSEELAAPVPDGPKPLVLYEKREVNGDVVRYSGLRYDSAIYMYDQITVRATTLEYSAKVHSIDGSGRVMWREDQAGQNGSEIHVSFRDGKPQIDLKAY
jgi:Carboxypeptidase regulatory-like domain